MKKSLVFGVALILLIIASVNAGIYFSQPESYYNIGDIIETNVDISPVLEGFLKIDLVCDGENINVFNGLPNAEGKANIKFPLTYSYIQENSGQCYFYGEYSESNGQSRDFEISDSLNVVLNIDNLVSKPGEEIIVSGTAKRLNGIGINGDVEINIPLIGLRNEVVETNESVNETDENANETQETDSETASESPETDSPGNFYGKVANGSFSVAIKLEENVPAGDYRINIKAYEQDLMGRITSEGLATANLQISQILKSIEIALNTQSIDPGKVLEIKPMLLDQAGNPITDEASIIIKNENNERTFEKIVKSDETFQYNVPTNLTAGYYTIDVSSRELISTKTVYVNEKAIASFELKNNTLIVTSIGNIPYKKDVQIDMNGKPFVKSINLELGESQEFRLAGDGEYDVKISDGETEITGGVALTGHAVSVEAVKTGILALNTPIVWIFFIIVLGAGLLFFFRNILKKKSFAYPLERIKEKFSKKPVIGKISEIEKSKISFSGKAEQSLVLKGDKNRVAVLCVRFKSPPAKTAIKEFENLIQPIYGKKGAVYNREDAMIAIFSPLTTKSFKNEIIAAKAAESVKTNLQEYNSKFADKIEFGIGIHSGEIVNKIEDGKLKFTALGNLISGVNRIADSSDGRILMTKEAYERAGNDVKAIKQEGVGVYEIRRVIDAEKNQQFIDGFLKRASVESKKGQGNLF
ncbi:MAG: hypothetical protein Q8N63_06890 [Nanoarchaeota archaeon]|nr:hypothetical protein [Nanoarchaeota archaeon]